MICDVSKYIDKCYIIGSRNSLSCECQFELNRLCLPKSKVRYIQYTLGKSFTDLKYFKKEGILQALRDACKNNYKKVLILTDDFLLINDSGFDYYFKHHCADILILNPKDIVKDCFLVDSKALEFMAKKDHPYNIFDVDTSQYNWWDDLYYQWVEYLMVASVQDDLLAHKIDYVLTYVDSNDPVWKAEYNKYKNEAPSNKENRWRDWDNFVFNLRGIAKNLPWINNVYIIVSSKSQVPSWIKNVIIVEHKEIIPSEFLPTFNSCTIESYICNIPGLSEYFIYGNDDTFILNPVKKTDFFNNGKIVCNFKNIKDDKSNFNHTCVNSFRFCMGDFNRYHINMLKKRDTKLKMQYHTPHPIIKSTGLHLYKRYQGKINSYATRFRSENINQYIYGDYEYITFNTEESNLTYRYTNINECVNSHFDVTLLCLNDNSNSYEDYDYLKQNINWNLYNKFRNKSIYDNKIIKFDKPKIVIKRNNVALCAIAKNENLYIREWVEWYKKIGICKIFLYDNNDINGEHFEDVINDYIKSGFVELINKRGIEKGCVYDKQGINLQTLCYIDAYENKCANIDWICFFDIDEFMVLNNCTLDELLSNNRINTFDTILVPWEHYDDNNQLTYSGKNVVDRFNRISKNHVYHAPKSIVKTHKKIYNKRQRNLIHIFTLEGKKIVNADLSIPILNKNGDWYKLDNERMSNCMCVLNHYKTKTLDEFIKRQLGRHWGTATEHTKNKRNYYDVIVDFYKYNYWNNTKAYFIHPELNYNAIIALTSWKKRINIVSNTINNLRLICGDKYKIVLTLSVEEFPLKELELPESLLNTNVEIIWVGKNYNCYKKVLFAMEKYPNIPIISADDDCLYKYDYASELYNKWLKNPASIITSLKENRYVINGITYKFSHGRATLFPPSSLLRLLPYIEDNEILTRKNDDSLYGVYAKLNKIEIIYLGYNDSDIIEFSTNEDSLTYELFNSDKQKAKEKFIEDKKIFIEKLS